MTSNGFTMDRRVIQARDLFLMRAHWGWGFVLLSKLREKMGPRMPWLDRSLKSVLDRLNDSTQRNSARFDAKYGTETFKRHFVSVTETPREDAVWGYGPVNHDFFREIFRSIPVPLQPYAFADIGSGKGAAILMASEFPFRRLIGVELHSEMIDVSRENVQKFNAKTGLNVDPEWVHTDFFKWKLPDEPLAFFFNNPFPAQITLDALEALERAVAVHPHPTLLVFRKAPDIAGARLHRSTVWTPLRLAPYWRVYSCAGSKDAAVR
jgi:hypothetical protein